MTLVKLAIKNILAKPGRFLLTSLAVLVGVALTTTVFVFTDSLRETFGDLAGDIESGFDVAVRSEIPFGERLTAATVGLDVPEQLNDIDGVVAVQPRVIEFSVIPIKADGEAATGQGPNIGINWEDQSPVPRLALVDGAPPTRFGEFVLDVDAAEDFVVGQDYQVQTPAGIIDGTLTGTFNFGGGEENAAVGAAILAFDTETAVSLLNDDKGYDDITLTLAAGTDLDTVIADIAAILPDGLEVVGQEVLADEQAASFDEFINIFRTILLVFAFIILLVSAFIIFNVFSIIVGQRIQEIGLLRALGANGSQITQSIVFEALVVGVFATIVGILLGLPLASLLQTVLANSGFGPEGGGTPLQPTTVIVAAALGIGLTLLAAVAPALRARGISPMAALRSDTTIAARNVRNPIFGATLIVAAVLVVVLGFVLDDYLVLLAATVIGSVVFFLGLTRVNAIAGRFSLVIAAVLLLVLALTLDLRASMLLALLGGAALIMFLGMNLLSPLFAKPVARAIGAPMAAVGGIPSRLARENAGRSPDRTATAASALMIGLALITTVAVVISSLKATFADVLRDAVTADWIVTGDNNGPPTGFSPALASALEDLPQLENVLPVSWNLESFRTVADDEVRTSYSTNLSELQRHFDVGFVDVDTSLFSSSAILIHEDQADDFDLGVGDTLDVEFANQSREGLTIAAIYSDLAIFDSGFVLSADLWTENPALPTPQDLYVTALLADGVSLDEARPAIEKATAEYSQLTAYTKAEFQENQESSIDQVLVVVQVLLLPSVILAMLGVAITLALSVFERTREIGLTRAVGATRKQMKRMVKVEGIIVAIFGGLLGVGLGLVFGIAAVQIIPDDFVSKVAVPWGFLIAYLIVAAVVGFFAALFPAWRASKLNVLNAIAQG